MTDKALDQAAKDYLSLRSVVLEGTPNRGPNLQKIVRDADFDQNMERSLGDLWNKIKLHPLYANMKVKIAQPRVNAIRDHHFVSDYEPFRGAATQSRHEWYVRGLGPTNRPEYTAVGREAKAFCSKGHPYEAMPYRTKAEIPYRWARLAALFCKAHDSGDTNARQFFGRLGDAPVEEMRDAGSDQFWKLRDTLHESGAYGPVTALHALMDCGFPCVKPDVWVSKIGHELHWLDDVNANAFRAGKRVACTIAFRRLGAIAERASKLDGRIHSIRELDAVVSWAGMHGISPPETRSIRVRAAAAAGSSSYTR